jgi:hypothetical protein
MHLSKVRAVAALAVLILAATAARAAGPPWPSRVAAVYNISFNGFDIGSFRFNSSVTGHTYALTGGAEMSALLGAFTWQGATGSSGQTAAGGALKPAGYTFDYKSNSQTGSVRMTFNDAGVTHLSVAPPTPDHGKVPVRDHHLKDVLDPLTAVMALSRAPGSNPCGRKIPVFDGKQRFDLHLSFRRHERVAETRPSGQPGIAFVCRIRYIPIAGHKQDDDSRRLLDNGNIEVALRPVPSANLLIPYRISVPTIAGTAVLTLQRIDITGSHGRIALVH